MEFDRDEANEEHIARHGISRSETEAMLADPLGDILDSEVVDEEIRYRQVGSTPSGRILVVVVTLRGKDEGPITAFDATGFLARRYREGSIQ
jgi:uncharacterized DUF497 family protein